MSAYNPTADSTSGQTTPKHWQNNTRHTKEDALTEREWELLWESAQSLDEPFALDAQLVVMVGGRLGLRAGEIAHLREEWVDWETDTIQIPHHDPCDFGRDGEVCGYCRQCAKQRVEHNDGDLSLDDALGMRWHPKTENSAREVPFGFSIRAKIILERYFDRYDRFKASRQGVNRRVEAAAEGAADLDAAEIYPHCLRATCASLAAGRGLEAFQLQQMLGWEDVRTAIKYVRTSGERTARALDRIHNA